MPRRDHERLMFSTELDQCLCLHDPSLFSLSSSSSTYHPITHPPIGHLPFAHSVCLCTHPTIHPSFFLSSLYPRTRHALFWPTCHSSTFPLNHSSVHLSALPPAILRCSQSVHSFMSSETIPPQAHLPVYPPNQPTVCRAGPRGAVASPLPITHSQ